MSTLRKIQTKCIQTRISNEGELLEYRLLYPITNDFKWYLESNDPDLHDFVQTVKTKNNRYRVYYIRSSRSFIDVKRWMYSIMIKSADFKIKNTLQKKVNLTNMLATY